MEGRSEQRERFPFLTWSSHQEIQLLLPPFSPPPPGLLHLDPGDKQRQVTQGIPPFPVTSASIENAALIRLAGERAISEKGEGHAGVWVEKGAKPLASLPSRSHSPVPLLHCS